MTDWKQQTFLGNFLQRGTKTLAGVPRAMRVKRIYFRTREIIAHCDAGENEKTKKKPHQKALMMMMSTQTLILSRRAGRTPSTPAWRLVLARNRKNSHPQ